MMQLRKECRGQIKNVDSFLDALTHFESLLKILPNFRFLDMIRSIEQGKSIGFEGAFLGFLYVVWANNSTVKKYLFPTEKHESITKKAVIFLMTMRFQEERGRITWEEIAWMVAATRFDFTFLVHSERPIVETCGMGWDIGFWATNFNHLYAQLGEQIQSGFVAQSDLSEDDYYDFLMNQVIIPDREIKQSYKTKNKKSVNISTLSSFILGSMGYATMKHGSGKNTTAVGSTDAVVKFRVPIIFSSNDEPEKKLKMDSFVYTDATISKTIHDISGNVLKTETVNHLIWPMTPPIDRHTQINKILWVNHNVSFSVLGKAYETIHEKGIYNIGDVIIVGWFSELPSMLSSNLHKDICLDEFSPKWSMLWVLIDGKYIGEFLITEKDFWVDIDMNQVLLEWSEDIISSANEQTLVNKANENIIQLVCCNAALGILVANGNMRKSDFIINGSINSVYLKAAYEQARKQISSLRVNNFVASIRVKMNQIMKEEVSI